MMMSAVYTIVRHDGLKLWKNDTDQDGAKIRFLKLNFHVLNQNQAQFWPKNGQKVGDSGYLLLKIKHLDLRKGQTKSMSSHALVLSVSHLVLAS